jgi:segregation and condensation protein B
MSLKSKLEAVIYASEEPVTLTQLATLFGAEALEWRAAQVAAAAEEAAANAAAIATGPSLIDPSLPMIAEGLEYLELRTEDGQLLEQPGFAVLPAADSDSASDALSEPAAPSESIQQMESPQAPPADSAALDPEAEAKRAARQRDREVKAVLRQLVDELIALYASDDRGVEIREIAGGYRMATKPEYHDAVRMFIKSLKPALKLSLPALETLAVIAYKQPVTAPEVNEIRGVDSSGVFGSLLARKLITTAGRKPVIGRPILYKTTKEFLMRFGLKDVAELPSMDEFEKMASELEDVEPTAVDEADVATAAYDTEGVNEPALDENAAEEPDNDSLATTEISTELPATVQETQDTTEPAE